MEGENPTRRYKWFRPRQAVRGAVSSADAGANTAVYLYNDSTATQLIVVRHWVLPGITGATDFEIGYVKGKKGTPAGNVQPLIPTGARLAGIITLDGATTLPQYDSFPFLGGNNNQFGYWNHEFPFAILEPDWSLAFVSTNGTAGPPFFALWEAIEGDELDFLDW